MRSILYEEPRYPIVPWSDVEMNDLHVAMSGSFHRDTLLYGQSGRQVALHVIGQYDRSLSIGLIALRCERRGEQTIPLTLSIPETPMVLAQADGDGGDQA